MVGNGNSTKVSPVKCMINTMCMLPSWIDETFYEITFSFV